MQKPEELYERIHQGYRPEEELKPSQRVELHSHMKEVYIRLALVPYLKKSPYRAKVMQDFADQTTEKKIFPVEITGEEHLLDADLVLGNHQGPSDGLGKGGFESLAVWASLPPDTSVVMKHDLLEWKKGIKSKIQTLTYKRANPIPFVRPDRDDFESSTEYGRELRKEFERVSAEICRKIREESMTVLMYPEGERSPTGKVLPFKTAFFEGILKGYVEPMLEEGGEPRVSLAVADTLCTMPQGYGTQVPIYSYPYRIHGVPFDTSSVMQDLREGKDRKKVARAFAIEAHDKLEEELSRMLSQYVSGSRGPQSLSGDRT